MSKVMRRSAVRYTALALAFAGLPLSLTAVKAGDLVAPTYGPAPYGAPLERDGICRILLERRIDGYGRETLHRIRMCDEGPVYPAPGWSAAPQEYGYPPQRRYYEPSRSYYDGYLRPPAPIGPAYFN